MISKEEYVLTRVKKVIEYEISTNGEINPKSLKNIIEQWEFDYKMEKEYRPEVLVAPMNIEILNIKEKFKEIKRKWEIDYPKYIYGTDIDWLIKQVEKYEQFKSELES